LEAPPKKAQVALKTPDAFKAPDATPASAPPDLQSILTAYSDSTPCWSALAPEKPKRRVGVAPQCYEQVSLRMRRPFPLAFSNIIYEANNLIMRGELENSSQDAGAMIAWRWHESTDDTRAVFVLRDSLFSQQDRRA